MRFRLPPLNRSANGPLGLSPTAMQALGDVQDTPVSSNAGEQPVGNPHDLFGVVFWIDQL